MKNRVCLLISGTLIALLLLVGTWVLMQERPRIIAHFTLEGNWPNDELSISDDGNRLLLHQPVNLNGKRGVCYLLNTTERSSPVKIASLPMARLSPDGKHVVSVTESEQKHRSKFREQTIFTGTVFDAQTGRRLSQFGATLPQAEERVWDCRWLRRNTPLSFQRSNNTSNESSQRAFSSQVIVVLTSSCVLWFDAVDGRELRRVFWKVPDKLNSRLLSDDAKLIAAGGEEGAWLVNAITGEVQNFLHAVNQGGEFPKPQPTSGLWTHDNAGKRLDLPDIPESLTKHKDYGRITTTVKALSPNNKILITEVVERGVRFDHTQQKWEFSYDLNTFVRNTGGNKKVWRLPRNQYSYQFLKNSKMLVVHQSFDGTHIYDSLSGVQLHELKTRHKQGMGEQSVLSSDRQYLYVLESSGILRRWKVPQSWQ